MTKLYHNWPMLGWVIVSGAPKFGAYNRGSIVALIATHVVDFRYCVLFRNENDSSANFSEKLKPNFALFHPAL